MSGYFPLSASYTFLVPSRFFPAWSSMQIMGAALQQLHSADASEVGDDRLAVT